MENMISYPAFFALYEKGKAEVNVVEFFNGWILDCWMGRSKSNDQIMVRLKERGGSKVKGNLVGLMATLLFMLSASTVGLAFEYQYPGTGRRTIGTAQELLHQVDTSSDHPAYVVGKAVFISSRSKKVRTYTSRLELFLDDFNPDINYRLQDPIDAAHTILSSKETVTTSLTVVALIPEGRHIVSLRGYCSPGPCEVEWVKLIWYAVEY